MPQASEREIAATVDAILSDWIVAEHRNRWPSKAQQRAFLESYRPFAAWIRLHGLTLPVSGHVVAAYLLKMAANGAALSDLELAANAIAFHYSLARAYLDPEPINAAFALLASQTSADRTLH